MGKINPRFLGVSLGLGIIVVGFQNFTRTTTVEVTGKVSIEIADDFVKKLAVTTYRITDSSTGKKYRIQMSSTDQKKVSTGSTIKASGALDGTTSNILVNSGGVQTLSSPATAAKSSGSKTVLVMPINFSNKNLSCPLNLTSALFTDAKSVNAAFQEMSYGALSITGIVTSPLRIPSAAPTDTCDDATWRQQADIAAQQAGYNLSDYTNKLYVFPVSVECPPGAAELGGNWAYVSEYASCTEASKDNYAHELGHNFGMMHANFGDPNSYVGYGDMSDIMGMGGNYLRQVNGPHKVQMGWVTATDIASGTYVIPPLELAPSSGSQVLRVPGSLYYYLISYRQPVGFDSVFNQSINKYADGASIHIHSPFFDTFLVSTLFDGKTFSDSNVSIKQISHDSSGVVVQVSLSQSATSCIRDKPALTVNATSLTVAPDSISNVNITIQNNNNMNCPVTNFDLNPVTSGGTSANHLETSITPNLVSLPSGQSTNVTLSFKAVGSNYSSSVIVGINQDKVYGIYSTFIEVPVTVTGSTFTEPVACVYNSDPDIWVASGLSDPCGAGTCMQCEYNVNKCVAAGRHWCNTGTGQAECWAVYERNGFRQADGSCGPLKYTWIPTGKIAMTLAQAKSICSGTGKVPTVSELLSDMKTANSSSGGPSLQAFLLNKNPSVTVPSQLHWLDDPYCAATAGNSCSYYRPAVDAVASYINDASGNGNAGSGAYVMCIK